MSSATTTTTTTTEQQRVSFIVDGEEDEQQQHEDLVSRPAVLAREMSKRVSRLAVVEGGGGDADGKATFDAGVPAARRSFSGARTLPPPHAWLAIKDTRRRQKQQQEEEHGHGDSEDPEAEQWARLLRGGATTQQQQRQQRRSSFSVVRRERAARDAWLDHAWEAKRSWHQRNGGAPDADTPVVVVVGTSPRSSSSSSHAHQQVGGGVAMDVEEVRACRDLGLELPSDCTVEIQCYGLSGGGSSSPGSGADSPCNGADSCPDAAGGEADPMDVKARLKVWAQAVALASTTTHLAS